MPLPAILQQNYQAVLAIVSINGINQSVQQHLSYILICSTWHQCNLRPEDRINSFSSLDDSVYNVGRQRHPVAGESQFTPLAQRVRHRVTLGENTKINHNVKITYMLIPTYN